MLTVPEAARRIGRHPETVRRWIRSGRLRSEKVGTQHLVREEDVDSLADDRPLDLPDEWTRDDGGQPMPTWDQLVRDSRASR
ncbi:MAG: helix-turn-helix domain-containing protein [Nitriliruptorales bacterium]